MGEIHTSSAQPDPLVDIQFLAGRWKMTPQAIYNMRHKGRGPKALRIGGKLKWRLSTVLAWEEAEATEPGHRATSAA